MILARFYAPALTRHNAHANLPQAWITPFGATFWEPLMPSLKSPYTRMLISGALMFILLGFMVDLPQAWQAIKDASWVYFGWLALWITLDRLLMAYKWRMLLTCRGLSITFLESLKAYYLATFAGCFLPSTVGADAMRIASVCGPGRPSEVVAASVIMERALGFLAAALAAGLALVLLLGLAGSLPPGLLYPSLGMLALVSLGVVISLFGPFSRFLENLPAHLGDRGKLAAWVGRFLAAYVKYNRHKGAVIYFILLSFLEQSVPVVGTWLTALAFGIDLSLLESAAVAPLALLFTRIPVSLSGFGVVEGLYVAFFALVGLNTTESFLLGLIANLSIVVTTAPGAFFYASSGFKQNQACPGDESDRAAP
jgi:uncharacterized protein (TIRG00374 family)